MRVQTAIFPVIALLLTLIATPRPAGAILMEADLFAAGDGLLTVDTESGLEWLDLTATLNLSPAQILADEGMWLTNGFRYATFDEVCILLAPSGCQTHEDTTDAAEVQRVMDLQALIGITGGGGPNDNQVNSDGFYDSGIFPTFGEAGGVRLDGFNSSDPLEARVRIGNLFAFDQPIPTVGNFLVVAVPEPNTFLLVGFGLGLAALRRRAASKCRLTGTRPGLR